MQIAPARLRDVVSPHQSIDQAQTPNLPKAVQLTRPNVDHQVVARMGLNVHLKSSSDFTPSGQSIAGGCWPLHAAYMKPCRMQRFVLVNTIQQQRCRITQPNSLFTLNFNTGNTLRGKVLAILARNVLLSCDISVAFLPIVLAPATIHRPFCHDSAIITQ